MSIDEEKDLIRLLREDDDRGMQLIFEHYYKYLVVTAYNIQGDDNKAQDLVQDVLFEFWKKRKTLDITISLKAYLRRAVVNKSIDEIRSRKRLVFNDQLVESQADQDVEQHISDLEQNDLNLIIQKTIEALPERCKLIFKLSRFESLSHKEIASQLGISTKTIENQITKALKLLRKQLAQYGKILIIIWIKFL